MKNLNIWRQSKFFGGKNSETPSTQFGEQEVRKIVNLFPNTDGSELKLRTAFTANQWAPGVAVDGADYATDMSMLACPADDPDGVYVTDGLLQAHVQDGNLVLFVSTTGGVIPAYSDIKLEQIWIGGGSAPIGSSSSGGDYVAPPSSLVAWNGTRIFDKVFVTPITTVLQGIKDYWVDDAGTFGAGNNAAVGNNASYWFDDDNPADIASTDTGYLNRWVYDGSAGYDKKLLADTWYDSASTDVVFSEVDTDLVLHSPYAFGNVAISESTGQTNPVQSFPTVTFKTTCESGQDLNVCFSSDATHNGAMVNVYTRDSDKTLALSPWVKANTKNIYLVDQSTLEAGERSLGTGILADLITVTKRITGMTNVGVKLEFLPNSKAGADSLDLHASGLFKGFLVGTPPAA